MTTFECLSCGGIYVDILADGTRYFHACPPLAAPEIRAALDAGTLTLSAADAQRLADAQAADAKTPPAPDEPSRAALVLSALVIERPNRRDENVPSTRAEHTGTLTAVGKGTRALTPADAAAVGDE